VRKLVKNISDELLDADLEQYINEAEILINSTMKYSFIDTFDATKHAILRSCATDLAALKAITYDPGTTFLNLDDAKATHDFLTASADRNLKLLEDPRIVEYLKSL